jgi:hypothetical protein
MFGGARSFVYLPADEIGAIPNCIDARRERTAGSNRRF